MGEHGPFPEISQNRCVLMVDLRSMGASGPDALSTEECLDLKLSPVIAQQLLLLAGIGLMCWLMLRGRMRRRQSVLMPVMTELGHNSNSQTRRQQFTGTQSLGAPTEVLKWQVELHDLGRELKAELDSKLVAVRSMSMAYDQAAKRLAEMIRLAEQVQLSPTSPLAEARRLAGLGWHKAQIASVLSLSESEIEQLLA